MRRALVVAHCDDETLWFGGLVAAEPGDWTIIACSIPRTDPIRAWKFFDACRILGAKPKLLPFTEASPSVPIENLDHLDLSGFDEIVTHNVVGEYGHLHHKTLHQFIVGRHPGKVLTGRYGMTQGSKVLHLDAHAIGVKMAALHCYDHVSPSDGRPKWKALLDRYGSDYDLSMESYDRP